MLTIWAGHDAPPSHAEYEALGLRIVLYPTMTSNAGLQSAWQLLNDLRAHGNEAIAAWRAAVDRNPWGRIDRRKLLDTAKIKELEEKYLPNAMQRDYAGTWGHQTAFSGDKPPGGIGKARR